MKHNSIWNHIDPYLQLIRFDKPIGTLLLLWPTLTALVLATHGYPTAKLLSLFLVGTFVMRSLGCILNDLADKQFDQHVERTSTRPLTSGKIKTRSALLFAFMLALIAGSLVLLLNTLSLYIAIAAMLLTLFYPFCKRFTYWPQVILGLTFNLGILMAFTATENTLPLHAWLLYAAGVIATMAYDTSYALEDKTHDETIGLKSMALALKQYAAPVVLVLMCIAWAIIIFIGVTRHLNIYFYTGLFFALLNIFRQAYWLNRNKPFNAFLSSQYFWLFVFLGTFLSYLI